MDLKERISSFASLGTVLTDALNGRDGKFTNQINKAVENQYRLNPWFTPENTRIALTAIAGTLTEEKLTNWTDSYPELNRDIVPLKAGVIMAGNIPLAGFHDFLSVLISGNSIVAKTSTKDPVLIVLISEILCAEEGRFRERIMFTDSVLGNFDIIIATGSNNSSRYFEYYFGKYPNIIRKNRNSVAVMEGDETDYELRELGGDIFTYFGLGCRSVSKIYIPEGYDIKLLPGYWDAYSDIIFHTRYANNYDYNKAIFMVNREQFHDSGFVLLKEEKKLSSPVSVLHYEYYDSYTSVINELEQSAEKIQCIAGRKFIPFGSTQKPELWDYADGIDTIDFLLKKNQAMIM
jgi:hypothetical protein